MATVVEGQRALQESPEHDVVLPNVSISPAADESLSEDETFHDAVSELAVSPTRKTSLPGTAFPPTAADAHDGDDAPEAVPESEPSEPSVPLDPKQIEDRVFALVEFYFGEDNYSKDQFLRKQAQQDPTFQGWISLDVLASFKKMKKITENRDIVLAAIRRSSLVSLNEDQTMVRRREMLPKDVEVSFSCELIKSHF